MIHMIPFRGIKGAQNTVRDTCNKDESRDADHVLKVQSTTRVLEDELGLWTSSEEDVENTPDLDEERDPPRL